MKKDFLAKITKDKSLNKNSFKFHDKNFFDSVVQKSRPGDFVWSLKRIREDERIRTLLENNYYWGVVIEILTSWGEDSDYWHALLKVKFLAEQIFGTKIEAEYLEREKLFEMASYLTTTEMTTIQFENYLTEIRSWASTSEWLLGVVGSYVFIPLPNEAGFENL